MRSTAPTTKRWSTRSERLWARMTSTPPGPRAPYYPRRKRSPTRGADAANANARLPAGPRSPQPNWTSSGWSVKAWATKTSPQGFTSHHAPSKPTSPTFTPSLAWLRASNLPKRQHVTPDRWGGQAFRRGPDHQQLTICIDFAYTASQPMVSPDRKVGHCCHCFGGLSVGAGGGVAGWRLVAEGGVGSVVVVLILPIADDDPGVRQ